MIKYIRCGKSGHRYTINGGKVLGVTTALGLSIAKPELMLWAGKCAAEEALDLINSPDRRRWEITHNVTSERELLYHLAKTSERRRDAAAERGTRIHKLAESLIEGKPVEAEEELAPYVQSCAKFIDEWKVRPLLQEKVIGSYRWGYAGKFDVVGELPDGRRVLFDYKTGRRVYPDTKLQLAAYRYADVYVAEPDLEIPMQEVGITEAKAVWLQPHEYQVIPLDTSPEMFKVFLNALQVAKEVRLMEGWKPEPEAAP